VALHRWRTNSLTAKACADTRQCASKALSSTGLAATREARTLTSLPRLFERSAQREASSSAGRKTEQASPDTNSPCGLFVPGEQEGLWPGAACKAKAVAAGDRFSEALTGVRARLCRADIPEKRASHP